MIHNKYAPSSFIDSLSIFMVFMRLSFTFKHNTLRLTFFNFSPKILKTKD